jgi:hypothetical protein
MRNPKIIIAFISQRSITPALPSKSFQFYDTYLFFFSGLAKLQSPRLRFLVTSELFGLLALSSLVLAGEGNW